MARTYLFFPLCLNIHHHHHYHPSAMSIKRVQKRNIEISNTKKEKKKKENSKINLLTKRNYNLISSCSLFSDQKKKLKWEEPRYPHPQHNKLSSAHKLTNKNKTNEYEKKTKKKTNTRKMQ